MAEKNQRGGIEVKKLVVIALASILVLAGAALTLAGPVANGSFPVELNVLPYARVEADGIQFGDLQWPTDFRARKSTAINLYTNTDVLIRFESEGFGLPINMMGYYYKLQHYTYQTQSFASGGWRGGWNAADSLFKWTGDIVTIPFEARLSGNLNEDNFYQIQAGDYADTITLTVSAYQQ